MRFLVKGKLLNWGGGSWNIRDTKGKDVLQVNGKLFSLINKRTIADMNGNVKYYVKNKIFDFLGENVFICNENGVEVAQIKKEDYFLFDHYEINSEFGKIKVSGDLREKKYNIYLKNKLMAYTETNVSSPYEFAMVISEKKNYEFYVALIVAIDNLMRKIEENKKDKALLYNNKG